MKYTSAKPKSAIIMCDTFPPDVGGVSFTASRVASYLTIDDTPATTISIKEGFIKTLFDGTETIHKTSDLLTSFNRHAEFKPVYRKLLPNNISPAFIISFYMGRCSYLAHKLRAMLKIKHYIVCVGSDILQHYDRYSVKWKYHKMIKKCSKIGLLSEEMRKYFDNCPDAQNKLVILPVGYNIGLFQPVLTNKIYDFIFVGRARPVKGLDMFLKALTELDRYCKTCLVVPSYSADIEYLHKCKAYAEQNLKHHDITWLGEQTPMQLSKLYNCSCCLVVPSRSEASPHVVLEAMSCNIPIIAAGVGRIPYMLGNNKYIFGTYDEFVALLKFSFTDTFDSKPNYRERALAIADPGIEKGAYRKFVGL